MKNCKFIMFLIGSCGYGLIEVLWRGHTHWSMLCAGGVCFNIFSYISEKMKKAGKLAKAFAGSIAVTSVELVFGLIFNVFLKKNVWDYSKMPLNLGGQICLLYSFFWLILSFIFVPFAGKINNRLKSAAK